MVRPKQVLMHGWDLDGDEVEIEATSLMARLFQHEIDHLDGVLMFDRMTPDQRKEAHGRSIAGCQEQPKAEAPKRRLRLQ